MTLFFRAEGMLSRFVKTQRGNVLAGRAKLSSASFDKEAHNIKVEQ
jgi:hypothetical protein